jgi:transglutaminase-like putative cysteine protease
VEWRRFHLLIGLDRRNSVAGVTSLVFGFSPSYSMILDATCKLDYWAFEEVPTVFMLRPRSGWAQWVMREEFQISPRVPVVEFQDVYGNLCQRVVMPPGAFRVAVQYRVSVPEEVDADDQAPLTPVAHLPTEVLHHLLPSRYCQSDLLSEAAKGIVREMPRTYRTVETIRQWIHQQVRYELGSSDTGTTAVETLNQRRGVCRDFAHLGIALCRALDIPARMVVGFLHEFEPMDLHAWFEAFIDGRWYTFDATEPMTRGNRIIIAYGRDATDVALATMFGAFQMQEMKVTVSAVGEESWGVFSAGHW